MFCTPFNCNLNPKVSKVPETTPIVISVDGKEAPKDVKVFIEERKEQERLQELAAKKEAERLELVRIAQEKAEQERIAQEKAEKVVDEEKVKQEQEQKEKEKKSESVKGETGKVVGKSPASGIGKGKFKITAYCACAKCCGKSTGITASGARVKQGVTVASGGFKFGTKIHIEGIGNRVVQDRGVNSRTVDVYFNNHSEALKFGVKYKTVTVI